MDVDGSTIDDEPERRRSEDDTTTISLGRVILRLAIPLQPFEHRCQLGIERYFSFRGQVSTLFLRR